MRVREETSCPSFLYRQPWRWVGVEALVGRNHTNFARGLGGRLLYEKIANLDADGQRLDEVYMGWASWRTRVMDIRLETWSMAVYAETLCMSTCRGVTYGHPMGTAKAGMLCRWIC